jgi:hypothetical protein
MASDKTGEPHYSAWRVCVWPLVLSLRGARPHRRHVYRLRRKHPSDIEFVVRGINELNGEYRITVYSQDRLTCFDVEAESVGYLDDGGVALSVHSRSSCAPACGRVASRF